MKICTLLGNCCDYIVFNFCRNQARIDDFRVLVALFIKQTKYPLAEGNVHAVNRILRGLKITPPFPSCTSRPFSSSYPFYEIILLVSQVNFMTHILNTWSV